MRRVVARAVSLVLIAGACGGDSGGDTAVPTTTSVAIPVTTSSAPRTTEPLGDVRLTAGCPGIGDAPTDWQITWVVDGELHAVGSDGTDVGCLVDGVDARSLAWSGDGTRLLAASRQYVLEDGVHEVGEDDERLLGWSRPAGRALLGRLAEGDLVKEVLDDDERITLPFLLGTRELHYHPAGTAIVGVTDLGDRPNILMMSNVGTGERWLVDNESATAIHDLAFDRAGALLFVADHDDGHHLHRLDLTTNDLTTVLERTGVDIGPVVASQFDDGSIATALGDCEPTYVRRGDVIIDLAATEAAHATPVAWLPDGGLLLRNGDGRCNDAAGAVYLVDGDGVARRIADGVDAVALRAPVPPPPPPPPNIDEAAPA